MNVSASDIRDVSSLPLSAELHDLLATGGFRTVSDLHNISPIDLARELNTSHSIALSIIQTASSSSSSPQQSIVQSLQSVREVKTSSKQLSAVTAKDIIAKIGTGSRALITFCKAIDDMLGGGIQVGQITEFCGVPGIGKTQLAIQLSLNVQIPEVFGGLGGECVYIDTGNKGQGTIRISHSYAFLGGTILTSPNPTAQRVASSSRERLRWPPSCRTISTGSRGPCLRRRTTCHSNRIGYR